MILRHTLPVINPQGTDKEMLDTLLAETFLFFRQEVDPSTGLTADKTKPGSASSIAAVGLSLSANIVAVERDLISKKEAVERTLRVLRFCIRLLRGRRRCTGYKGFYYHFLEMHTGRRACNSELSTVDTAILMAGILTAAAYFTSDNHDETEIRTLADALYRRVDWQWALNGRQLFATDGNLNRASCLFIGTTNIAKPISSTYSRSDRLRLPSIHKATTMDFHF